ncbi:MAG: hypothetical protein V2A76_13995 [Planctomycetota bacterium]
MRHSSIRLCCGFVLALAAQLPALAQSPATLTPYRTIEGDMMHLGVRLEGASGTHFHWSVCLEDAAVAPAPRMFSLGIYPLSPGGEAETHLMVAVDDVLRPDPLELFFRAEYLEDGQLVRTRFASLVLDDVLSPEEPMGDDLDFDWGLGGIALPAGTIISDTQPWSEFMTITASGGASPILLDSGNPTGGDNDLATPGTGSGNTEPLGQLLVIGANTTDADHDGLVDIPQSNPTGGTLIFDFPRNTTLGSLRVVDVDEPGGEIRLRYPDGTVETRPIPAGQDNGVQEIYGAFGVVHMELALTGSAGVGLMVINPCLSTINFDETTTGVPLGAEAGEVMPDMTGALIFFTAENDNPDHPDKAILFDSAHPTGGDTDLLTPGPGPGNGLAQRKILVLAENDADADDDGIIDDPDDEAAGGSINVEYYTSSAFFEGATVVDVDANEAACIEVHLDQGGSVIIPLESRGDNSVQTVTADHVGPTRWIQFHFSGSGGIAEIKVSPSSGEV